MTKGPENFGDAIAHRDDAIAHRDDAIAHRDDAIAHRDNDMARFVDAMAHWIQGTNDAKVAAVTVPMGVDPCVGVTEAIARANAEPVTIGMHGSQGVDLLAAAKSPIAVTFRKKVIVVYEFDAIVSGDSTLLTSILAAIKINKVPVVLLGHSFRSKASELPKGHAAFQYPQEPERVVVIVSDAPDARDDKGLAGAIAALRGKMVSYRGDGIALGGVFDNYLGAETGEVPECADAFSWADVVSEQMCRGGAFDDPYSFLPISRVSLALRTSTVHPSVTTFGTVWSKTNAMYAKVNSVRSIATGLAERSRTKYTPADGLDLIRTMIGAAVAKSPEDAAAVATKAGVSSAHVLALMRLGKSKYTLTMHGKVKKNMSS